MRVKDLCECKRTYHYTPIRAANGALAWARGLEEGEREAKELIEELEFLHNSKDSFGISCWVRGLCAGLIVVVHLVLAEIFINAKPSLKFVKQRLLSHSSLV